MSVTAPETSPATGPMIQASTEAKMKDRLMKRFSAIFISKNTSAITFKAINKAISVRYLVSFSFWADDNQ